MKSFHIFLAFVSATLFLSCQKDPAGPKPVKINYHCATMTEGRERILANTEYYGRLTQNDIDWKARKARATLDEYKAFAQTCVQEFSEEEKGIIGQTIGYIEDRLAAMGALSIPFPHDDIVFIKTTMEEEGGAAAYTHKTEIYLCEKLLKQSTETVRTITAHELFHCLTRNSPDFRKKMYGAISFHILEEEIDFSPDIRDMILANPDVEHQDNYATFTIGGEKRNCALLSLYTATWEEAYAEVGDKAQFFDYYETVLIPIDTPDTWFSTDDASDFWDVMGKNTDYIDGAEECMADNFSFAVVPNPDKTYKSPWLIEKIIDLLRQYL